MSTRNNRTGGARSELQMENTRPNKDLVIHLWRNVTFSARQVCRLIVGEVRTNFSAQAAP